MNTQSSTMDLAANKHTILDENFLTQAEAALEVLGLKVLPETQSQLRQIRLEKLKALQPRDVQTVSLMLKQDKYIADIQKAYNFLNSHFELAAHLLNSKDIKVNKTTIKHG